MSNGGSLRSDNIAYAQMWNGECGMWNEGDFARQNPIVCRCRLNVECGMGNVE